MKKLATPAEKEKILHFLGHYTTFVIIVLLSPLYFFITLVNVTLKIQMNRLLVIITLFGNGGKVTHFLN